ncbi:hypothetical protein PYCCODRAFT_352209 [Trametes coccinea BRFM310]|uniref:C2H2-type domain-containing protein n=1 Tax=Trametes coccinea (strain BRFM310) TaxID=1353009 RepID=A0A1Y2J327_TRAC3|nr:hypothetical protein PYCCODRAFT_352209 [Trametes coccinea BRFM310]
MMTDNSLSTHLHSEFSAVVYTPIQGAPQVHRPSEHNASIDSHSLLSPASRAFSDNITNTSSPTVHRSMKAVPSYESENISPEISSTDAWEEDSEEAKAIIDFGIQDSEEEEEKAIFDSIPGFDDAPKDDENLTDVDAQTTWRSTRVRSNSPADSVGGEDDLDGEADGAQSDGDESSSDPESSTDSGTDTEDSEGLDGGSIADINNRSTCAGTAHAYAYYYDHMSGADNTDAAVFKSDTSQGDGLTFAHSDAQGSSEFRPSESVHCSLEGYKGGQEIGVSASMETEQRADNDDVVLLPNLRPLRRSARLKRTHEDTPDRESEPPRAVKRRHTTARMATLAGQSVVSTETKPRRYTVEGKKAAQPARSDNATVAPPTNATGPQDASHAQKATRSGRVPEWYLIRCIVVEKGSEEVACGINSCTTMLTRTDPRAARKHIRSHFSSAQRKASTNVCPWIDCGQTVKTGKNEDGLLRHFNEAHLKLRYECPGKCTDKNGKKRTWARTDELKRHEERNPCDYLQRNPIPRSSR